MSATIEQALFANYFARPVAGKPECAPVVKLDGRTYDVAEFYLEDIETLGRVSNHLACCLSLFLCNILYVIIAVSMV